MVEKFGEDYCFMNRAVIRAARLVITKTTLSQYGEIDGMIEGLACILTLSPVNW